MKTGTKIGLLLLTFAEIAFAVFLNYQLQSFHWRIAVLAVLVILSLLVDWLLIRKDSAQAASHVKRLKDADDYIEAFEAWIREESPFEKYLKLAIGQLDTLKRRQVALRTVLNDEKDSPFLSVSQDVDTYILKNCRRMLNRILIYDSAEPNKYPVYAQYLENVLGDNAHVLSDFENLILEISQIGEDQTAATPCLNELTAALRSVREEETDENGAEMQQ